MPPPPPPPPPIPRVPAEDLSFWDLFPEDLPLPRPATTPADPWASDFPAEDLLAGRRPPPAHPEPEPADDLMITEFLDADLDAPAAVPRPDRLQLDELLDQVARSEPDRPGPALTEVVDDYVADAGGDHPAGTGAARPGGGEHQVRKRKRARRSGRRKRPEG